VFATQKVPNYISDEKELPDQWKESIIVLIHKNGYNTVLIIVGYD
jgi:hypothetical protein